MHAGADRAEAVLAAPRASRSGAPAIVYAPTRKGAEELADVALGGRASGGRLPRGHDRAAARDRVQTAFLAGELDVVVATIAFGMGSTSPTCARSSTPGCRRTVEGYYQEIGRAGRDGKPSRAVLLYSWADRRTHEYFLERDYPEPEVLERVFRSLSGRAPPDRRPAPARTSRP